MRSQMLRLIAERAMVAFLAYLRSAGLAYAITGFVPLQPDGDPAGDGPRMRVMASLPLVRRQVCDQPQDRSAAAAEPDRPPAARVGRQLAGRVLQDRDPVPMAQVGQHGPG